MSFLYKLAIISINNIVKIIKIINEFIKVAFKKIATNYFWTVCCININASYFSTFSIVLC